jgi:hypothetical protein
MGKLIAAVLGLLLLLNACGGDEEMSPEATNVLTSCVNIVQPVNWPRLSPVEETRIRNCVARKDPSVLSEVLHHYGLDGR